MKTLKQRFAELAAMRPEISQADLAKCLAILVWFLKMM